MNFFFAFKILVKVLDTGHLYFKRVDPESLRYFQMFYWGDNLEAILKFFDGILLIAEPKWTCDDVRHRQAIKQILSRLCHNIIFQGGFCTAVNYGTFHLGWDALEHLWHHYSRDFLVLQLVIGRLLLTLYMNYGKTRAYNAFLMTLTKKTSTLALYSRLKSHHSFLHNFHVSKVNVI